MEGESTIMEDLYVLMDQVPAIKTAVYVIVIFRLVFKPFFTILSKYFELSVNAEEGTKLAKFMDSKFYKMLDFIVDYSTSIKLPKRK